MSLLDETVDTFITDENIKNFIWFIFDNDLVKHRDVRGLFRKVRWNQVYNENKCNHIEFHEIFICVLHTYPYQNNRYNTLSVFPDFQKHVVNMFDEQYRNNMLNKNERIKIQTYQNKYGRQNSSKNIPQHTITYKYYDELAYEDFWQIRNIKTYLQSIFKKPFYVSAGAYSIIFNIFDDYLNYLDTKKHRHTFYDYIAIKMQLLSDSFDKNYEHFCHNPVYAKFCLEHIRARKAQFVWFYLTIYNNYKNESVAENLFANEYLIIQIYNFL